MFATDIITGVDAITIIIFMDHEAITIITTTVLGVLGAVLTTTGVDDPGIITTITDPLRVPRFSWLH